MTAQQLDATHDRARQSWVPGASGHPDFPVQNLPFGSFSLANGAPRPAVAIGDHILDLRGIGTLLPAAAAAQVGISDSAGLLGLSPADRRALRARLSDLLSDTAHRVAVESNLYRSSDCRLHLPMAIGDYTDFYVGIHHATNVGRLFRPDNPLLENYKHIPIAYHGRASSVRVSGEPVRRPSGQRQSAPGAAPLFGPSERLDFELELGVWIGTGNALGSPISMGSANEHIAGLCLLNDWSARDIQAWEYQPLGPFLAKNFLTSVSPWVVTGEALAPFRVPSPSRPAGDPRPLAYLDDRGDRESGGLAIDLEVGISTTAMRAAGRPAERISASSARHMYWTTAQMVAHHSANGCNLRRGDLLGTGTISSADDAGLGSLLEMTRGGSAPLALPGGEQRRFLEDGDEIVFTGHARAEGFVSIGFGACVGRVRFSGGENENDQ